MNAPTPEIILLKGDHRQTRFCEELEVSAFLKTLAALPFLTVKINDAEGVAQAWITDTGLEVFRAIRREQDQSWIVLHEN